MMSYITIPFNSNYNSFIVRSQAKSLWDESEEEREQDIQIIEGVKNNHDLNFVSKILSPAKDSGGLASVAGMDSIKKTVRDEILFPIQNVESYRRMRIPMPNGFIMFGPPGCGKTYLATKIAEECHINYAILSPSDFNSMYWGGTQKILSAIFADARLHAPCLLFFDEFESIFPNRAEGNAFRSEGVSEILTDLNGCGDHGVFAIFATNLPCQADPAIFRSGRISKKIFIGLPDKDTRRMVIMQNLDGVPHDENIDYKYLTEKMEGKITSDIVDILNQAKAKAIRSKKFKVSQKMIEEALSESRPSVKQSDLDNYIQEADKYLGKPESTQGRRRIGFNF